MKNKLRNIQLKIMGIVAIVIGPLVLGVSTLIYNKPFPMSISETGTIANQVAPILPFCLGMLAIFALSYSIAYAYSKRDSLSTLVMFIGFSIVALQMCDAPQYITQSRVGVLGVKPGISALMHNIGALTGFGALIYWIMFCFTKSNLPKEKRTKQKNFRNKLYYGFGITMLLCLITFTLSLMGIFGEQFPLVFVLEVIILTFSGFACLIKGEMAFRDKKIIAVRR